MICIHHNDADGRCAAFIVWYKFKDMLKSGALSRFQLIEMDYNKADSFMPEEVIRPGEEVYIVDFSFKPQVMRKILDVTSKVTWCDHHVTAAEYDYGQTLRGYRDFTEKGLCGAECTWVHLYPEQYVPAFVWWLGEYDSWRMKDKYSTICFYEGLKLENQDPRNGIWLALMADDSKSPRDKVSEVMTKGESAIKYRDMYCADMIKSYGFETEVSGHKAFACNIYRFGSQGFGKLFDEYPILVSYVHTGKDYVISFYSQTVDVSEIAKTFGGGGHKGAAGCVTVTFPFPFKGLSKEA